MIGLLLQSVEGQPLNPKQCDPHSLVHYATQPSSSVVIILNLQGHGPVSFFFFSTDLFLTGPKNPTWKRPGMSSPHLCCQGGSTLNSSACSVSHQLTRTQGGTSLPDSISRVIESAVRPDCLLELYHGSPCLASHSSRTNFAGPSSQLINCCISKTQACLSHDELHC